MSWLDTVMQGLVALNTVGTAALAVLHNSNSKRLQAQGDNLSNVLTQVNAVASTVAPVAAQVTAAVQQAPTPVQKVEAVAEQLAPVAAAINPEASAIIALLGTLAQAVDGLKTATQAHTAALSAAPSPSPAPSPTGSAS